MNFFKNVLFPSSINFMTVIAFKVVTSNSKHNPQPPPLLPKKKTEKKKKKKKNPVHWIISFALIFLMLQQKMALILFCGRNTYILFLLWSALFPMEVWILCNLAYLQNIYYKMRLYKCPENILANMRVSGYIFSLDVYNSSVFLSFSPLLMLANKSSVYYSKWSWWLRYCG